MKKILFTSLLRNNENYIPYMFKIFKMIEKNLNLQFEIKYLIYTNNNKDNTEKLLKESNFNNLEIIIENLEEHNKDLNDLEKKVERLYRIREKFLKKILKRDFDYLIMFDSDIYFNSSIILEMIKVLETTNYEAITTNTIGQNFSLYYDFFSLVDENNKSIRLDNRKGVIDFHLKCFKNKIINVKSAFGGLFLTKSEIIRSKNLSYINNIKIDNSVCEHIPFNKNFNLGFVTDINPIRLKLDTPFKHKKAYNIIKKNRINNREIKKDLFLLFIEILLALFSFFIIITKKRYSYIFLLTLSICMIVNNFEEFF